MSSDIQVNHYKSIENLSPNPAFSGSLHFMNVFKVTPEGKIHMLDGYTPTEAGREFFKYLQREFHALRVFREEKCAKQNEALQELLDTVELTPKAIEIITEALR